VGHAQESFAVDDQVDRDDALAAALRARDRQGLAAEDGAARSLSEGSRPKPSRAGERGFACLAQLGPTLPTRAVQEAGHHDQGSIRRLRSRHDRPSQQRLRRGDARSTAAGQTCRSWRSNQQELHRHRLAAVVAPQAFSGSPVRSRRRELRLSRSTRNGQAPNETGCFIHRLDLGSRHADSGLAENGAAIRRAESDYAANLNTETTSTRRSACWRKLSAAAALCSTRAAFCWVA
jgi:hypothetical protein